ncbi:hypothetical protein K438DRAFT_1966010 [Mycena galopus ATCC 62051]|nr:hypothetical protein K438DRAFT_1966010 [Mycena galopus ATCC 62051]
MGKLNIAYHKSYHLYRRNNIEKVRRDEQEARRNEAKDERRMRLADSEARIDLLCERHAGVKESSTVEYGVQTVLAPPACGIPWMLSERAYPGEKGCARSARATLCASRHAAFFSISSISTSSFALSHPTRIAGGVLPQAHGDLPPFPVRDATLEYASFTRTVLRVSYEGGGSSSPHFLTHAPRTFLLDHDAHLLHSSIGSSARATSLFSLLTTFPLHHLLRASLRNPGLRRPSFLASPPVPLRTPTVISLHCLLRGAYAFTLLLLICAPHAPLFCLPIPTLPCSFLLLFGPCATASATSSSIITTRDPEGPQAPHNPTSIAMLRTKARLKPKRSAMRTTTPGPYTTMEEGRCSVGGADTEVVRRVPAPAFVCADVAPAFFDVLYPLRGRPVWGLCPCPSSFVQYGPHTALLADVGDLVRILIPPREGGGVALPLSRLFTRHASPLPRVFVSPPSSVRAVYYAPSPVLIRRSLDGRRTNDSVHTPTDD